MSPLKYNRPSLMKDTSGISPPKGERKSEGADRNASKISLQQLRKNQTEAEQILWEHIRNRQLAGFKFRRQHKIGPYVVDFVCLTRKLIIELDGFPHMINYRQDDIRSLFLAKRGFRITRFWNGHVLNKPESVLRTIHVLLIQTSQSIQS